MQNTQDNGVEVMELKEKNTGNGVTNTNDNAEQQTICSKGTYKNSKYDL